MHLPGKAILPCLRTWFFHRIAHNGAMTFLPLLDDAFLASHWHAE